MAAKRRNNTTDDIIIDWNVAKKVAGAAGDAASMQVIPFPLARRGTLVKQIAGQMMMEPSASAAERLLAQQLRRQAQVLGRKGVPAALIERELKSLESASRTKLWRWLFGPSGAI
jgi:Family of unknown function (DUF6074)